MIRVKDVWHHYGVRPVLKNVSMEVQSGELVAVMGPNGMGKSTLLGVVGGVLHPVRGCVEINGKVRRSSPQAELEIRKNVVYLPANAYLPSLSTGREFLLTVGRLYGIDELHLMEHVTQLLDLFDLGDRGEAPIRTYSTGQRKKLELCSALVTEAKVLLLDEPFSGGLDSSALLAMNRVLKSLADRQDVTVLMAVPVPELVEGLAHRIAVVAHGELIAYNSADGLRQDTGVSGDLADVLEKLINPDTFNKLDAYLSRSTT